MQTVTQRHYPAPGGKNGWYPHLKTVRVVKVKIGSKA